MKTKLDVTDIESVIQKVEYVRLDGTNVTICWLTLRNGFVVTGESSCVDPAEFKETVGKDLAFAAAKKKVWELEGYLLKQRMFEAEQAKPKEPKRVPVKTAVTPNMETAEDDYFVKWSDGAVEKLTREQAVALRREFPSAFSGSAVPAGWPFSF